MRVLSCSWIGSELYALVKPDATEEEMKAAVEGGGDQIFTQAVRQISRCVVRTWSDQM